MTAGELIDAALGRSNAGSSQVDDSTSRLRASESAQAAADEAWTHGANPRRYGTGTISIGALDDGVGSMPADFGSAGPKFALYVSGQRWPITYMDPMPLFDLREMGTETAQFPDAYTFRGVTPAGRLKVHLYRRNAGALTLVAQNYQVKVPKLVDRPGRCVAAEDAVGLLDGAYTYKTTFVTADGETEGGVVSESITVALKKVQLTEIPVSPVSTVTSRKIYRTAAGGEQHMLVATIADNVTTTYLDNTADGSLGDDVPTAATAVSGLEKFPEDFHRVAMLRGTLAQMRNDAGDGRAPVETPREVLTAYHQMWMSDQVVHTRKRAPRYGAGRF